MESDWPRWFESEVKRNSFDTLNIDHVYGLLTEQAWPIKDLLHGFRGNFLAGHSRYLLAGKDSAIVAARVANHSTGFPYYLAM